MPRYLVERTFPEGLHIPIDADGAAAMRGIVACNTSQDVTWIHSYISEDKQTSYCVYDGPNPEAIRRAAHQNGLPIDRIIKVSVLDPYGYQ